MKKKHFFGLVFLLLLLLSVQIPVFAKEKSKDTQQVVITTERYIYKRGQSGQTVLPFLVLKDENGEQLESVKSWDTTSLERNNQYELSVGTYKYRLYSQKDGIDFGGGEFSVEKDTSKITLRLIEMHGIVQSNYRDQMTAKVSHQDGRVFIPSSEDSYNFYLPCYDGDSYYNFELVPNDTENYVTQRGHFYNYAVGGAFKQLNLSDQHDYRLMKKHEFVAKVPKGTEICHTSQSRFYMARDYENLEKLEKESVNDPTDTVKFAANQYEISTTSDKEIYLDEDGEYKFSSGYITFDAYTGQEEALGKAHRGMTRSSLYKSNYTGGLSELRPGRRSILPDFSFEVEDGVNKAEDDARRTGTLSSLKVMLGAIWKPKMQTNTGFSGTPNVSRNVTVQSIASDENAKIYVRTWKCGDSTKSSFIEVPNGTKSGILGTYDFSQDYPMWVEVLVKPTTGYPKVYATEIFAAPNAASRKLLTGICNVTVTETGTTENFGRYDGVLECVNADCEINGEKPTNLYGFVGTQTDYVTSVPYETEKIDLNVFPKNETTKYTATTIKRNGISLKSVDSDGNETDIAYGEPISLNVGENKFVITQTCKGTKETVTYTYHLTVTRRPQARTITFKVPEDATVLVTNGKDAVQKPQEDGSYKCENGTYTWHVSKDGYLTTSGSFTVTDDSESQIITVEDLEAVPEQSGNVSVRIAGQNAVLRPTADVEIPKEIEDLKAHRYVK